MLTSLNINNFAIIKQLNVDFDSGFSVITGETGAGKSIAIDALSLCMGYRSDVGMVKNGSTKAQVTATFSIDEDSIAYKWLAEKSLLDEDQPTELIIRRMVNINGPSKAYINEHPVSISFLKELTQYLVHLHGQHAPQLLLKSAYQLTLVDRFVNKKELLVDVQEAYNNYKKAVANYKKYKEESENFLNTKQLLEYKHSELREAKLIKGEFEDLEHEYKILSNAAEIQEYNREINNLLNSGQVNINHQLTRALDRASRLEKFDSKYSNLKTMLEEALINIQESSSEAERLMDDSLDLSNIIEVENRLQVYNSLARKNHIMPEELYDFSLKVAKELADLSKSLGSEEELLKSLEEAKSFYHQKALKLSKARKEGAKLLGNKVAEIMQELNLKNAQFFIEVNYDEHTFAADGSDSVRFMLNSNLGQQAQELSKVASGGELSRIALAIQLLTASHLDNGTLIFDEVDVGISGKTATVVGRIIRQLSSRIQILSVTHLAQVAAYATNHYQVEKWTSNEESFTKMTLLDRQGRIEALASLIGHQDLSPRALANATELLELSQGDASLDIDLLTGNNISL